MSKPVGVAPEFWIVRGCQGKVRRKFLGLIPFVRRECNPDLFGAWFLGPFATRDQAEQRSTRRIDKIRSESEMDPNLVLLLREQHAHDPSVGVGLYLSAGNLADPVDLLDKLRAIWAGVVSEPESGDPPMRRREAITFFKETTESYAAELNYSFEQDHLRRMRQAFHTLGVTNEEIDGE